MRSWHRLWTRWRSAANLRLPLADPVSMKIFGNGKTSQTGCGTMMVVTLSVQISSGRKQNHVPPESNVNQHKGLRLLETITYNLKDIHGDTFSSRLCSQEP
jgi:hypothetical protein